MTSYVCKSSQSSLVKGFIPDNSTRLNYARAREGRRCSDKRLLELVTKALYALEDPAAGFVFDDFDLRYRERERKREADAARHYYREPVVRVEKDEILTLRKRRAPVPAIVAALVDLIPLRGKTGILGDKTLHNLPCPIRRAIIDDLHLEIGVCLCTQGRERTLNITLLVIARDDNGN